LRTGVFGVIATSGLVGKVILLILLGFSVAVWAVIIDKVRAFSRIEKENKRFLHTFRQQSRLEEMRQLVTQFPEVQLSKILKAGLNEWQKLSTHSPHINPKAKELMFSEVTQYPSNGTILSFPKELIPNILSAMERAIITEGEILEHRLGILATSASVCPFLGLFGTVWGVMDSFIEIHTFGSANINVVAPGIAAALITTVAGLAVAIPAVMAYNYFVRRLRRIISQMEIFASELAGEIRREIQH